MKSVSFLLAYQESVADLDQNDVASAATRTLTETREEDDQDFVDGDILFPTKTRTREEDQQDDFSQASLFGPMKTSTSTREEDDQRYAETANLVPTKTATREEEQDHSIESAIFGGTKTLVSREQDDLHQTSLSYFVFPRS